jgi:hypothetical protein
MVKQIPRWTLLLCFIGALAFGNASHAQSAQPAAPTLSCSGDLQCVSVPPPANNPYSLGTIPTRFGTVQFASVPVTNRSVSVSSSSALSSAVGTNGSRIVVSGGTYSGITIRGSDIDLVLSNSATITGPVQVLGTRVRITGGVLAGPSYSLMVLDTASHVTVDNVRITRGVHVYSWNGNNPHHISIVRSTIRSGGGYGILMGENLSHIILAGNDIRNEAPDFAGIRIIRTNNVIFANNRIFSSGNRIVRLHEQSNLHLWVRNQFETSGSNNLWIGPWQGVPTTGRITAVELIENSYYGPQSGISGFPLQLDADQGGGIADVVISNNRFFTPGSQVTAGQAGQPFVVSGNTFAPYRTPPAMSVGADH